MEIDLCDTEEQFKSITVLQLREKIIERLDYRDIPEEEIRLIWQGKELGEHSLLGEDYYLLSAYGISQFFTVSQFKSITVLQLKEKIAERWGYQDFRGECLRLIFRDKSLVLDKDSSPLSAYGIQHMSHICALVHVPGGSFEPGKGDGGMGDKGGKNRSKEKLLSF